MNLSKISVRYAKAVFLLAKEKDVLKDVYKDFILIKESIRQTKDFEEIISSPVVSSIDKQKLLNEAFAKVVNEISMRFMNMLIDKNRETYLLSIARNFEELYRKENNIKEVVITTKEPINKETSNIITDIVSDKYKSNIEIKNTIKENMIGGIIIRIDNQQLDLSIQTQLQEIKKKLRNKSYTKQLNK